MVVLAQTVLLKTVASRLLKEHYSKIKISEVAEAAPKGFVHPEESVE